MLDVAKKYSHDLIDLLADAICKEIVTDCWTYNRDPKAIRKQRKIILEGLAGK